MGHATVTNISQRFNRLLHKNGVLTIKECVDDLERTKAAVSASEGKLTERYMLALATEYVVSVLLDEGVIEPVSLTKAQKPIFRHWKRDGVGDDWDAGDDGNGGEYGILDSIKWRSLKKRLPVVRQMES